MTLHLITNSNQSTSADGPVDFTSLRHRQIHPLVCSRTGLTVATLTVEKVAGHVPYLSQWKHTQALHPLFSLEPTALLQFSRSIWNHFCNLSPEQAADATLTDKQELLLRIAALAMVHHLAEVDQTTVWIPALGEVSSNWSSLLALSYWKNYLESKRFRFPNLRISKFNHAVDLTAYIQDCWQVKKEYETRVRESVEKEKLASAERALKVLRDDLAGKAPKSKKILWRWFLAHLPSRYAKDAEGWMWELFDAETEGEISEFTIADIDLFEEITLCEIPTGSSISHAFLERVAHKRKILENKFTAFEILVPAIITAGKADGSIAVAEPKLADFAGASNPKIKFLVAHAKWKLAHASEDSNKHRDAARAKQERVSVAASHIPDISKYLSREETGEDSSEDDNNEPLFDLSTKGDVPITGEMEE